MSSWIPTTAKYFTIETAALSRSLIINFSIGQPVPIGNQSVYPIADLAKVLGAFSGEVNARVKPAIDHALKKLLAPGQRGVKDERQDLVEARDSLDRAIQQIDEWA